MRRRIAIGLLACLLFAMTALYLPTTAYAAQAGTEKCTLTIDFHAGDTVNTPIPGASFRIYRVAEQNGKTYRWTEAFQDYDVSLEPVETWTIEQLIPLAATLAGYVTRDSDLLTPDAQGVTGSDGKLILKDLEPGVYLVMGDPIVVGNITYTPAPFLVSLPAWNDGEMLTDVVAAPKYTHDEPEPNLTEIYVLKVWDDGGAADRPKQIVVQLLCDGEVYREQTLNEENNWRYAWTDLPEGHTWKIVEKEIPSGYTVKVEEKGNVFTLTNSKNPPPPPDEPKLPQTGQIWWPVPLLVAAGMIAFAAGMLLVRQEEATDESKE